MHPLSSELPIIYMDDKVGSWGHRVSKNQLLPFKPIDTFKNIAIMLQVLCVKYFQNSEKALSWKSKDETRISLLFIFSALSTTLNNFALTIISLIFFPQTSGHVL